MQRIYAPWRSEYFGSCIDGCVFCQIAKNPQDDEQNRVIYRDDFAFGVMKSLSLHARTFYAPTFGALRFSRKATP